MLDSKDKIINDDILDQHNLVVENNLSFIDKTKNAFHKINENISSFFYKISHKYLITKKFAQLPEDDSEILIDIWSRRFKAFWILLLILFLIASFIVLTLNFALSIPYLATSNILSYIVVYFSILPIAIFYACAWYGNACSYRVQFWIKYILCKIRLVKKRNWSFYLNDVRVSIHCMGDKSLNSLKKYILRESKDYNSLKYHPSFANYYAKSLHILNKGPYFTNPFTTSDYDLSLMKFKRIWKAMKSPKGYWKNFFPSIFKVYFKKPEFIKQFIDSNEIVPSYYLLSSTLFPEKKIIEEETIITESLSKEITEQSKPKKKNYDSSRKKKRGGKK